MPPFVERRRLMARKRNIFAQQKFCQCTAEARAFRPSTRSNQRYFRPAPIHWRSSPTDTEWAASGYLLNEHLCWTISRARWAIMLLSRKYRAVTGVCAGPALGADGRSQHGLSRHYTDARGDKGDGNAASGREACADDAVRLRSGQLPSSQTPAKYRHV